MARYVVSTGRVAVTARSKVHDTTTIWSALSGTIDFDAEHPERAAVEVRVDMQLFDAGDRLRNWKLRAQLEPDKHPTASFVLDRLEKLVPRGDEISAEATGSLRWRNLAARVRARGSATVEAQHIRARASFELDVRELGIQAPRLLMFRMDDVVKVDVEISANALLA